MNNQTGFNPHYSEQAPTFKAISELSGDTILEFGAPWCQHCQLSQTAVEEAFTGQNLPHIKIYDGKGKILGRKFKVKLWPTLIKLHNGKEIARIVRPLLSNEVRKFIDL